MIVGQQYQQQVQDSIQQTSKHIATKFQPKMLLSQCVCLEDFREHAKISMPRPAFEYIDSAAQDQITMKENILVFHRIIIIPRILQSISSPCMSTSMFNRQCKLPFGFAPFAMNRISHESGECIPAKVAFQREICYCLSVLSTKSFAEVQSANSNGLRFMQVYVSNDWQKTMNLIHLAQQYGFTGLAITVDAQVLGIRRQQARFQLDTSIYDFQVLNELSSKHQIKQPISDRVSYLKSRDITMNWSTIAKIRASTKLKIVLKGIMNHLDAKIAINYCDAIWVSNHGGRQLDTISSTIRVLPGIKAAVAGKVPVYIDCGIRTGTDIFKCLAFGADYVFIGRPVAYALTFGYDGVNKVVDILEDQLRRTMILTGCKKLTDITSVFIKQTPSL